MFAGIFNCKLDSSTLNLDLLLLFLICDDGKIVEFRSSSVAVCRLLPEIYKIKYRKAY